jgi:hypothetical protein
MSVVNSSLGDQRLVRNPYDGTSLGDLSPPTREKPGCAAAFLEVFKGGSLRDPILALLADGTLLTLLPQLAANWHEPLDPTWHGQIRSEIQRFAVLRLCAVG